MNENRTNPNVNARVYFAVREVLGLEKAADLAQEITDMQRRLERLKKIEHPPLRTAGTGGQFCKLDCPLSQRIGTNSPFPNMTLSDLGLFGSGVIAGMVISPALSALKYL